MSLCNFFQEIAGNHATRLKVGIGHLNEEAKTWVLTRLKVVVNDYPLYGESVRVETWPYGVDRLQALRCFRLWNRRGDLLAHAYSSWVIIDLDTRRPVRIPDEVARLGNPNDYLFDMDLKSTIPDLSDSSFLKKLTVGWGDLDINRHVNNVRYIEWGLEALPVDVLESNKTVSLEIQYKAECGYGDSILTEAERVDPVHFIHRIKKEPGGEILARMNTVWKPNPHQELKK